MDNEQTDYTVTATGTYFVKALSRDHALDIVYEAMLGNDPDGILGTGEVHYKMHIQQGTKYTIQHGKNLDNTKETK
jgi:hypothetical protein